jgi:hypothetical protein
VPHWHAPACWHPGEHPVRDSSICSRRPSAHHPGGRLNSSVLGRMAMPLREPRRRQQVNRPFRLAVLCAPQITSPAFLAFCTTCSLDANVRRGSRPPRLVVFVLLWIDIAQPVQFYEIWPGRRMGPVRYHAPNASDEGSWRGKKLGLLSMDNLTVHVEPAVESQPCADNLWGR